MHEICPIMWKRVWNWGNLNGLKLPTFSYSIAGCLRYIGMTVAYGWVASETKTVCDYCCCVTHVESSLIPRHVWEEEMSFGTRLSGVYIRSTMAAYNVKLMVPLSNRNQVIYIHMSMYMQPTTKKHCLHGMWWWWSIYTYKHSPHGVSSVWLITHKSWRVAVTIMRSEDTCKLYKEAEMSCDSHMIVL